MQVQNPECRLLFPEFGVGGQGGISESLDFHGIPVLQKSKQYSIPERLVMSVLLQEGFRT